MKKIILILVTLLSLFASMIYAANTQTELNKTNVAAFYNEVINNKNFEQALKYIGDRYIQHNPNAEDGTQGLKKFIQFLHDNYPKAHSDIKRIFAEDNYVILHVHAVRTPGTKGNAIVDIFRLDDAGKIVEHWDVVQEIPEKSANNNGMF